MLFLSVLLFVFIFGLIVLIHELGHFLAAKREGMTVREFAFGFPPRLFSIKKNGTNFSLNLIPFGGYVSILGESESSDSAGSYSKKSPWARLRVVSAGVLMNALLAWVLLTVWFWIVPFSPQADAVAVASVLPNTAAEVAGIKTNDFLVSATLADGTEVAFASDTELAQFTKAHRGETLTFDVRRNGDLIEIPVTLGSGDEAPLGVELADLGTVPQIPWWQAPWAALQEMWLVLITTLSFLGTLILQLFGLNPAQPVPADAVSGPVGIFSFLRQTITLGIPFIVRFAALISLAVGIFNALPFPALDGGRAVFILFEGIFGKRAISHEKEAWVHTAGFTLLILMILVVTYFDLQRL